MLVGDGGVRVGKRVDDLEIRHLEAVPELLVESVDDRVSRLFQSLLLGHKARRTKDHPVHASRRRCSLRH